MEKVFLFCNILDLEKALSTGQITVAINCQFDGARGIMYNITKADFGRIVNNIIGKNVPTLTMNGNNDMKNISEISCYCPECQKKKEKSMKIFENTELPLTKRKRLLKTTPSPGGSGKLGTSPFVIRLTRATLRSRSVILLDNFTRVGTSGYPAHSLHFVRPQSHFARTSDTRGCYLQFETLPLEKEAVNSRRCCLRLTEKKDELGKKPQQVGTIL